MKRIAAVMGVIALAGACGGCGLVITQAPPGNHAQLPYFSCTESNAGPIIDLAMGALYGISALTYNPDSDWLYGTTSDPRPVWGAMGAGLLASGAVGLHKTSACRAAKLRLAERQQGAPAFAATAFEGPVASVTLRAPDTLRVGDVVQLSADARTSGGQPLIGRAFSWTSSNDAIASVSGSGRVTANAEGRVVIAARTGIATDTRTIVVRAR